MSDTSEQDSSRGSSEPTGGAIAGMVESIARISSTEGLGSFKLGDFFAEALKPHSEDEVEEIFIVGTTRTTPSIEEISIEYPRPWLFFKLATGSLILFYGFVFAYNQFSNPNLIPGLIGAGAFAIPVSTLVLFFEVNIRRNVPLWQVGRLVLFGGILSLVFALILFEHTDFLSKTMGASVAAIVEEPAKLGALLLLLRGKRRFPYILNGLLLGAAVGCGFAVFESAGYALRFGLSANNIQTMVDVIQLRGILSPFAHIVWTAIAGAALWRVQKGRPFRFEFCQHPLFYKPFFAVVVCHAVWNSNWQLPFFGKYIICGLVAWIIALSFVNLGIKQIALEKSGEIIFSDATNSASGTSL